jgi:cystathionine beta-lyase/cystathionine gamma-synthase
MRRLDAAVVPYLGARLSPFEAWLLVRGMRTLEVRMRAHEQRGLAVARWLRDRPEVVRLRHPAIDGKVDGTQLAGTSGLFSFELRPGLSVERLVDALRLFRLGVSWGGHESLVFPAEITHRQAGGANSARDFGVSPRTVRLHVGLEGAEDLRRDLEGALAASAVGG